MKILFIANCPSFFPSGIVRVAHYFPHLDAAGIKYRWISINSARIQTALAWLDASAFGQFKLTDLLFRSFFHLCDLPYQWVQRCRVLALAKTADVLFFQSVLFPVFLMKWIRKRNPKIIFDYDDALYVRNERGTRVMAENSWKVFAGSHALLEFARQYQEDVVLLPSCVDIKQFRPKKKTPKDSPLQIGWIGSASTNRQLNLLREPFQMLSDNGCTFEFVIIGAPARTDLLADTAGIKINHVPNYRDEDLPALAAALDAGVMPLFDTPAEQGKCALKMLIYMAAGIPVISSPVGEANHILKDGVNGFFASTATEWVDKLREILLNADLRMRLGEAGRKTVEEGFSLDDGFIIMKREMINPLLPGKK